jgi:hypothetical protein
VLNPEVSLGNLVLIQGVLAFTDEGDKLAAQF